MGRAVEHQQLSGLLDTAPLVTLTGPAGVGKSVLARAVLEEHTARHDGTVVRIGCWDGLADGGVTDALLRAAGLPDAAARRETARALAHRTAHPCVSNRRRGRAGRAELPDTSTPAVAAGGAALDALTAHCRKHRVTLLLDDCDPVLDECAQLVRRLLRADPGLRIMATARRPLGLPEERIAAIAPLPVTLGEGIADRPSSSSPSVPGPRHPSFW
ncbi:AAA family ATPase [Streptomyces endophytica]|uniref:ATP-binding protein n=1 Tax=Streptomyces endophytica TaxID=2991496 RepID=A0ABY6PGS2_9ACTN|nr:ATP-binding protein [Streptomyces endophytica]UZJ33006.1 ATP-binding protein [Streptomyces endophytica]